MTIRRRDPREQGSDRTARADAAAAVWIRPSRPGDEPAIRAMASKVLSEFDLALDLDGVDRDLDDIERSYRARGGEFWVVETMDVQVAGTCGVWFDPEVETRCELRKMYLEPGLRGRGLGQRLLDTAIEHARRAGRTRMELETNRAMTAAIGLYRARGFREVEPGSACADRCDRRFALEL